MPRRLPPLVAMRAFEAAGRLLSFSKAGEELRVGQSAISHHVKALEQYLGIALFHRQVRRVSLTPEGAFYLEALSKAFDGLARATHEIAPRDTGRVRVRLLASFAVHWLMPRIDGFRRRWPHVDIVLDAGIDVTDLGDGGADLAIRYGRGDWSGVWSIKLMDERLSPVMSPDLLARSPGIAAPRDLIGRPILASSSRGRTDWDTWCASTGLDPRDLRIINLHDYNIVLQSAIQDGGVAMGRRRLVQAKVRSHLLVRPLDLEIDASSSWWLVMKDDRPSRSVASFIEWIIDEAKTSEADEAD